MRAFQLWLISLLLIDNGVLLGDTFSLTGCPERVFGTSDQRKAIKEALYQGSSSKVRKAIQAAARERMRFNELACPDRDISFTKPEPIDPSLNRIIQTWDSAFNIWRSWIDPACPLPGRATGVFGLANLLVRLAPQSVPQLSKNEFSRYAINLISQQYTEQNAPKPLTYFAGVFAYYSGPPELFPTCVIPKAITEAVNTIKSHPEYLTRGLYKLFVPYISGIFSGSEFLVSSTFPELGVVDGGLAYDQGWAGEFLLKGLAYRNFDPSLESTIQKAVEASIQWSIQEPPVVNSNYTAKLIWHLSQAYLKTKSSAIKKSIKNKLTRGLLPAILTDFNEDGRIDFLKEIAFSDLGVLSRKPGRFYDGHNLLSSYFAMNLWALVEAYAAFRDAGAKSEARRLKPYVMAGMENLVWEINHLGIESYGPSQPPIAILLALWKIADAEKLILPEWEEAAQRLWPLVESSFTKTPDYTVSIALYMLRKMKVSHLSGFPP